MPFLTVIGHTNIDVQLAVDELPSPGESRPVRGRRTVYGGTACNIARHAAGLDVPVRLWSRVGSDMPPDWSDDLLEDGVELAFDTVDGGRTPTCFVFTDADDRQSYCMDQGAMTPPYAVDPQVLDGASWLHVSTGDPASYLPVMKVARRRGISVALDPGQEIHFAYDDVHFQHALDHTDVLFANAHEMERMLDLMSYGDPVQFLDHVDAIVVTHGADGARLIRAKGTRHAPAPAAEVVDPTGAGDCFRAAWYAALHAGHGMETALAWGVAGGALGVGFAGPQSITLDPASLSSLVQAMQ